jgi:hypothetical protein
LLSLVPDIRELSFSTLRFAIKFVKVDAPWLTRRVQWPTSFAYETAALEDLGSRRTNQLNLATRIRRNHPNRSNRVERLESQMININTALKSIMSLGWRSMGQTDSVKHHILLSTHRHLLISHHHFLYPEQHSPISLRWRPQQSDSSDR